MAEKELLVEANERVKNGQHDTAISLLRENIKNYPQLFLAMKTVGKIYLLNKQPEKVVIYLKKLQVVQLSADDNIK